MAPGKRPFQIGPLGSQPAGLGPGFIGPQGGAVLPFGFQLAIPFRAFLEARLPNGHPTIPDDVLVKMYDELVNEIKKRGVKS